MLKIYIATTTGTMLVSNLLLYYMYHSKSSIFY